MNKMNLMKQRMIYLMLALLAASCSNPSAQQTESANATEMAEQAGSDTTQTPEVDGISGATNVVQWCYCHASAESCDCYAEYGRFGTRHPCPAG